MALKHAGQQVPNPAQCRYDGSRLTFRGPRKNLDGAFVACLGGTETYGRFVQKPYPDLLEEALGVTCVNFGWPNAGIDVFAKDRALLDCVGRAVVCVLQVPCAVNMSNMYYRVHPRRNDRFLEATPALRSLYPEVDFTGFSFTRHLLGHLLALSPDRFAYIRQELDSVWVDGMQGILRGIGKPVVLLWLSRRRPDETFDRPDIEADPALVSRDMLDALEDDIHALVEVQTAEGSGKDAGPTEFDTESPLAHKASFRALTPVLAEMIGA